MDDLPILPFEKILSHLSLKDRIKARAVSRSWRKTIDSFKVKTLCYSEGPRGGIYEKDRWVSGAFAQNFIGSSRFELFFDTFNQSILSSLKHLRLCDLKVNEENIPAFALALNSLGQLEELDLIRFVCGAGKLRIKLSLNLPMLNSVQLKDVGRIAKLTLDAPRLQKVRLWNCFLFSALDLVHGESVERLLIDKIERMEIKKLKNLKYLYRKQWQTIDPTFLSSLEQLKELHLFWIHSHIVEQLFDQKRQYNRTDLKIHRFGLMLDGPNDPLSRLNHLTDEYFPNLIESASRLANEIPFQSSVPYEIVERVAPGLEMPVLARLTDLKKLIVDRPVQNIKRLLKILRRHSNIVALEFSCDQPQELFDRLPDHAALQVLTICEVHDSAFLFRLNHLISLHIYRSIDDRLIRKAFEELKFLSKFIFKHNHKNIQIQIVESSNPKQFKVWIFPNYSVVSDLNAVIQFIIERTR